MTEQLRGGEAKAGAEQRARSSSTSFYVVLAKAMLKLVRAEDVLAAVA